jgi:16S rRNA processing protein RimM
MAQVLSPYGVQGWIRLRPFSGDAASMLGHRRWWLRAAGSDDWREVTRAAGKVHSGSVLALLDGVTTREAAVALRGAQVGVPRSALPALAPGEVYWADLVGLEVVNREGVALGQVVAVQDYGAHPVLRVVPAEGQARAERLIPFVPAHVDDVDLPARRIEVDWQPDY